LWPDVAAVAATATDMLSAIAMIATTIPWNLRMALLLRRYGVDPMTRNAR
jgi:hypothetical protein